MARARIGQVLGTCPMFRKRSNHVSNTCPSVSMSDMWDTDTEALGAMSCYRGTQLLHALNPRRITHG